MDAFVKRLLTVLAAIILLAYIGFQAYMIFAPSIKTDIVYRYTAFETVETTCTVIRNETLVKKSVNGYISYTINHGSRVAKGGVIAHIYKSEEDALAQQAYHELETEIALLTELQTQSASKNSSLSAINTRLDTAWLTMTRSARATQITDLQQYYKELLYTLNKQQIAIGKVTDFTDRIAALTEQKTALAATFKASSAKITSPIAGYFVGQADGYEEMLNVNSVKELTAEQVQNVIKAEPAAIAEDVSGKVVADYDWYIACVLPYDDAIYLSAGANATVKFPFVTGESVVVNVVAANKDKSGQVAVIMQCSNMSNELANLRNEQIQIQVNEYSGLRVADSALQFRTNTVTGAQESGVFVRVGNTITFKKINVLYHSENDKYSICEITTNSNYLQLYDTIVTGGKNLYEGKVVR